MTVKCVTQLPWTFPSDVNVVQWLKPLLTPGSRKKKATQLKVDFIQKWLLIHFNCPKNSLKSLPLIQNAAAVLLTETRK